MSRAHGARSAIGAGGLGAVLALAACGGGPPIPPAELLLRIHAPAQVESGKAFPLMVQLVWSKDLEPPAWSDRALLPLVVKLIDVRRQQDRERYEETRRYQAYAFARSEVVVAPPALRATRKTSGGQVTVEGQGLQLAVRPALAATAAGPPDLPGGLLAEPEPPSRGLGWPAAALAVLALAWLGWRRRAASPRAEPPPVPEAVDPRARALERLAALRQRPAHSAAEIEAAFVELADLVREYAAARFAVHALEMTSEELVAAVALPHRRPLSDLLASCDLVKFARARLRDQELLRALDGAGGFVSATSNGSARR